ncbi:chloride channel protein, partial [Mycobacterium tuberculosis]|nr:chloride channel protein [Mycobacterium tuberculosis]
FIVPAIARPSFALLPLFVVFGAFVGLVGVAYNWLIRATLRWFDALSRLPAVVKAAAVGAVIGAVMQIDPDLVGGGDALSQKIFDGQR